MNHRRASRPLALLLLLALVAAACGGGEDDAGAAAESTTSTTTTVTPDDTMAMTDDDESTGDMDDMDDDHDHADHGMIEWDGGAVPAIDLEVIADPKSGWNVFANVSGYVFAPEHASTEHVAGEGHAHIDIDGERLARVYGDAFHIAAMEPGTHEITYTLAANSHDIYAVDGEMLTATTTIEVGEVEATGHSHTEARTWDGDEPPIVDVEVVKDAKSGWNLLGAVTGFTVTPEAASTDHVRGEGHMHIYINGERLGRTYTPSYHLATLPPGDVTVELRLAGNDHLDYEIDGEIVAGAATIAVSEADGTMAMPDEDAATEDGAHDHTDQHGSGAEEFGVEPGVIADHVFEATVTGGSVDTAETRYSVSRGDIVELRITADEANEVHLHGYDILVDLMPGMESVMRFSAELPGIYEVELERGGALLFEIAVS